MITTRPLKKTDWPHIAALFGPNGACGGCWCMVWRVPKGGAYWREHKGEKNRREFQRLVQSGEATGILAFDGKEAIGWLSIAPRESFAYFDRARKIPPAAADGTWSVTCFFVKRGFRRKGVSSALLSAAVEFARRKKARIVEGYPTASTSAADAAGVFIWTGVAEMFEQAGFVRSADAGARVVYRIVFPA
jgi:GNAT superfamily N-acetyltransferase